MKKVIFLFISIVTVTLMVTSCKKEEKPPIDHKQVDAMYSELLQTYKAYADSLQHISHSDTSGTTEALLERFEVKMWEINKRYPPELDYSFTQVQNDTLYHYFQVYVQARARVHHPAAEPTDTVANDSVL